MRAVDTNVIARYLLGDNAAQLIDARRVIRGEPVYAPVTVMLELEWVLRRAAGVPRSTVIAMLSRFAGLPTVTLEDADAVGVALGWAESGMDFADALHLVRCGECSGFATFDRDLIRLAARTEATPVTLP